nr:B449 [uncultured bacterium]
MFLLRTTAVLVLLLITSMANAQKTRIATGVWGGLHINLEVGRNSAKIEYDCAFGAIEGPLVVDGNGKFELRGSFTQERGGPVRADETPESRPAIYSGTIRGNTMTLTLKVSGVDEAETFTLEHGKAGELFKCK